MGQQGHSFTDIRFPDIVHEPLDPGRPFAVSAQATILRYFREVLDARPHVMANDDIEAVHEIRVAARRTRTALQTFSTLWNEKDVRRWLDYLAKIADAFTIARDTDVLIEYLEKQLKGAGKPEQAGRAAALSWLLDRARQRRHEEQPELERLLRRSEKDHSAESFVQFFSQHPVDLWHYNRPLPDSLIPELQAPAEPVPDSLPDGGAVNSEAWQEAETVPASAADVIELPSGDLSEFTLEEQLPSLDAEPDPAGPEPGATANSPADALGASPPEARPKPADAGVVRIVLEPARYGESASGAPPAPVSADECATDPAEHPSPAGAAELGAQEDEPAPAPFADIAAAVLAELGPEHAADDAPSVEAAHYHPQEGRHGQG